MIQFPSIDVVSDYVVIFAALITVGSIVYVIKTYTRNRKLEQIKLLDSILKELKEMQKEVTYLVKEPNNKLKLDDWDNRFFNTCEWLAFLINTGEIKDKNLENYFEDTLVQARDMFDQYAKDTDKPNPKRFREFKKLLIHMKVKVKKTESFMSRLFTVRKCP